MTERRTRADFADFLRWVVERCFPMARRVVLVTDNLNIHTPGSLYEAHLPPVARRLAERLEWHYTPKHESWLNVAEGEADCPRSAAPRGPSGTTRSATLGPSWLRRQSSRNQQPRRRAWR